MELLEDDERNTENVILVATHFHMLASRYSRLCIIDTPGVNSATNKDHGKLTQQILLTEKYDLLVYMVNAKNIGIDDDHKYLTFIGKNIQKAKVTFVLNKLDSFNTSEDSISDSVENLHRDLCKYGFDNLVICPLSSYAGELAKKVMYGITLNEYETDDYAMLAKKFKQPSFDLSAFYDVLPISESII